MTVYKDMNSHYLRHTEIIDWQHPSVTALAKKLVSESSSRGDYVEKAFVFVRDRIRHSWDFRQNPVTCRASEVLEYQTGYCYAKSHLLAALLRANQVPAGLCYQRLSLADDGAPYCLHGLNAVYLEEHGWYRIDARGNKPGVDAQFTPPVERLAFSPADKLERDLAEIWPDPLPVVVEALTRYTSVEELYANLPDIEVIGA